MGKKTVKEKTPIEYQFDQVKSKVKGWENYRKSGSQIGPWILLILGALVATMGFFSGIFSDILIVGIIVGSIGILIIIGAWSWSRKRSKGERDVEDKIFNLKGDLALLEKEQ